MMNIFESKWFIAIIGEVYPLGWKETDHLYFNTEETISLYYKNKTTRIIWFMLPNNFTNEYDLKIISTDFMIRR